MAAQNIYLTPDLYQYSITAIIDTNYITKGNNCSPPWPLMHKDESVGLDCPS